MSNEHDAQAEANKAIFRSVYDAVGGQNPAKIADLVDVNLTMVRPDGHPVGGLFKGREAVAEARRRSHEVIGPVNVTVKEVFADGPTRVAALMQLDGTDANGDAWTLPSVEIADIIDGKITRLQLFVDTARLHDIAALKKQRES